MKFTISSHKDYISTTERPLIDSLLNCGIDINDIYVFVGGYDINQGYKKISPDYNKFSAPHNSIDFTGLISILEMNIKSDYWFLLHDTSYVGGNFFNEIKKYNYTNKDTVALTFDTSMNIGAYKWEYLLNKRDEILTYKNNDNTFAGLQSYKRKLIENEDCFLKPKIHFYTNENRQRLGPPTDYYNNSTPRIIEYFPKIDYYKIKANWELRPTYEIKL